MVRLHPGSLEEQIRSVGVSSARRRGKAEGRVQFPDGPLDGDVASAGMKHLVCNQESEGSIPSIST